MVYTGYEALQYGLSAWYVSNVLTPNFLYSRQWKCRRNLCIEIEPESRDAVMRSLGAGADEVQENSPLMMPRASALRYVVLTYVMSFSRLHVLL